ncbi:homoserine/homoserine lactone efflux protein, partial [Vibrio parahaemolyticus AQ3810]
MDTHVWLAYVV